MIGAEIGGAWRGDFTGLQGVRRFWQERVAAAEAGPSDDAKRTASELFLREHARNRRGAVIP